MAFAGEILVMMYEGSNKTNKQIQMVPKFTAKK
jgi:hypothetical protein